METMETENTETAQNGAATMNGGERVYAAAAFSERDRAAMVRLVLDEGKTIKKVSEAHKVSYYNVRNWVNAERMRRRRVEPVAKHFDAITPLREENEALKRALSKVREDMTELRQMNAEHYKAAKEARERADRYQSRLITLKANMARLAHVIGSVASATEAEESCNAEDAPF